MPARITTSRTLRTAIALGLMYVVGSNQLVAQQPPGRSTGPTSLSEMNNPDADIDVAVRDAHGSPLEVPAVVHLYSVTMTYNDRATTQGASKAHFSRVPPGDYQVEVECPGYKKANERFVMMQTKVSVPLYIYLIPENVTTTATGPPRGVVMSPQLQADLEKAIDALNKKQFESARKILAKTVVKSPANADLVYYLGLAELGLKHTDSAVEDFQKAIALDPNHELALVALGGLQLESGAAADAVVSLEKAVATGLANWRADFQLASAYFQVRRFSDAEAEAARAVRLAKGKGAAPALLLGEIQYAEGKKADAMKTWQALLTTFPSDPIAPEAKRLLAREDNPQPKSQASSVRLPLASAPEVDLVNIVEHPWAPPDIDSPVSNVVPDLNCRTNVILDSALRRMRSELNDFEKFTATEHIQQQEVDRYGLPGPMKEMVYSYVVSVHPFGDSSFYLDEARTGEDNVSSTSLSVKTTGLNNLGVSVLQPIYRERFSYSCEGLNNVRGQAAWQIRFEEIPGAKGEGVRRWHRGTNTYEVPVKGRIWISSVSYAVIRIESDIRERVEGLELTKDHLLVDYGPVNFTTGNVQLWLPWSADMYLELAGKRYHHRHFLSDYMLFGVDTTHKIDKPAGLTTAAPKTSP